MKVLLFVGLLSFVADALECPSGWLSGDQFGKCLYLANFVENFNNAESICESFNGQLVSIHSAFEQTFIHENVLKKLNGDYLIGLRKDSTTDVWTWLDGSSSNYTDWKLGSPKDNSTLLCAASSKKTGKWYNVDCKGNKFNFICEAKPITTTHQPSTLDDHDWIYNPQFDAYFKVVLTGYEWQTIEDLCQSKNAHLTSIHSQKENDYIRELAYNSREWPVWIGLHAIANGTADDYRKKFAWTDGTLFNYDHFAYNEPSNDPNEPSNCVYMDVDTIDGSDEEWFAYPCYYPYYAVCKREA